MEVDFIVLEKINEKSDIVVERINNFEYSFRKSSKKGIQSVCKALTFKNPDPFAYSNKIQKFNKNTFIFRIPSRFMTVFFGFDPCVTIYYEILFRKSEIRRGAYAPLFVFDSNQTN